MLPLTVGILKIGQHKAHGTSLVALGVSRTIAYALKGSVDVTASLLLAVTAIFTARAGARYAMDISFALHPLMLTYRMMRGHEIFLN